MPSLKVLKLAMAFSGNVSGTIKSEREGVRGGIDGSLFEKEKAFSGIMEEERKEKREEEKKRREEEKAKRDRELTVELGSKWLSGE